MAFVTDGFPHAQGVFNGHAALLPYSVLQRDGYLRADSPVRRAWESTTPAAPGIDACPPGHEPDWWR